MGLEIERRFIVKGEDWRSYSYQKENLQQGYLISNNSQDWAVRVRIINHRKSLLTLKYPAKDFANHEFEYEIPINDAKELMNLSKHYISKTRYHLSFHQSNWVVDDFHDNNSGLVLAEIELSSISEKITIPSWCQEEITGIRNLSNASLARTPISEWFLYDRLKNSTP